MSVSGDKFLTQPESDPTKPNCHPYLLPKLLWSISIYEKPLSFIDGVNNEFSLLVMSMKETILRVDKLKKNMWICDAIVYCWWITCNNWISYSWLSSNIDFDFLKSGCRRAFEEGGLWCQWKYTAWFAFWSTTTWNHTQQWDDIPFASIFNSYPLILLKLNFYFMTVWEALCKLLYL